MSNNNSSKSLRNVYMSMMTLILSIAMLTAATWALFSATRTVNHHISAGNLYLEFKEVTLTTGATEPTVVKDLADDSSPVFETSTTFVYPSYSESKYVMIKNVGTVDFDYRLSIINAKSQNPTATAADAALLAQTKVKIEKVVVGANGWEVVADQGTLKNSTASKPLNVNEDKYLYNLLRGTANSTAAASERVAYYRITILFDEFDENNDAMDGMIEFDLNVTAVQDINNTADLVDVL